jgi:hypothetical protein
MAFPSTLSTFNRPTATDRLNSPSHSALHNTVSSAVGQIEAVIGVEGANSVVGTLEYFIKSPDSNGGGHVQTANKGGTGQTSYTKGDLLVATSASVLAKLAVGNDNAVLQANSSVAAGVQWGAIPGVPTIRTYTSSVVAIWNKPSVLSYIIVETQGAGGNASTDSSGGAGGGGGGYTKKVVSASLLGLAASVLAGSAGVGSGLTYFGSVISVFNGGNASGATGGTGGVSSIAGDFSIDGIAGQNANGSAGLSGGAGGGAFMGKGGASGQTSASATVAYNGQDGQGYGSGGGGNNPATDGNPTGTSGVGKPGIVIVYEY